MNRIAQIVFATTLAALSVTGCKRSSEPPKYAIVDGEELVVPGRGGIIGIDKGIRLTFPKGYRSETFKGCDFYRYSYHAPHNRGTIEFYLGGSPNYNDPEKAELLSCNFGRLKTTFRKIRSNNGFSAYALVPSYFPRRMSNDDLMAAGEIDPTDLQIVITTNDETYFQEAWAILNTAENQK
jgi:hypothetical protein